MLGEVIKEVSQAKWVNPIGLKQCSEHFFRLTENIKPNLFISLRNILYKSSPLDRSLRPTSDYSDQMAREASIVRCEYAC